MTDDPLRAALGPEPPNGEDASDYEAEEPAEGLPAEPCACDPIPHDRREHIASAARPTPAREGLEDAAREVVRFYGTDRTWSLMFRTLLGSRIDDLAAALARDEERT